MKIPLFEILALIFILWPLIQRFLNKNKPQSETDGTQIDGYENGPEVRHNREREEWDRAMSELESIFTGEPIKEPVHPAPVPEPVIATSQPKEQAKAVHSFYEERIQKEKTRDEFVAHITDALASDAIYKSLDEHVVVEDETKSAHSIFADIKDLQRIREFYVMKEVLDKPRSKRPVRSRLLTS